MANINTDNNGLNEGSKFLPYSDNAFYLYKEGTVETFVHGEEYIALNSLYFKGDYYTCCEVYKGDSKKQSDSVIFVWKKIEGVYTAFEVFSGSVNVEFFISENTLCIVDVTELKGKRKLEKYKLENGIITKSKQELTGNLFLFDLSKIPHVLCDDTIYKITPDEYILHSKSEEFLTCEYFFVRNSCLIMEKEDGIFHFDQEMKGEKIPLQDDSISIVSDDGKIGIISNYSSCSAVTLDEKMQITVITGNFTFDICSETTGDFFMFLEDKKVRALHFKSILFDILPALKNSQESSFTRFTNNNLYDKNVLSLVNQFLDHVKA